VYLSKGQLVDVDGRLQTRQWDDEADGACYSASRFVTWIERNLTDHDTRSDDTRAAGQRRWRG